MSLTEFFFQGFYLQDGSIIHKKNKSTNTICFGQKQYDCRNLLDLFAEKYNGRKRYNRKYHNKYYGDCYTDYLYIKLKENPEIQELLNKIEIPTRNKSVSYYSPKVSFMSKYEFGQFLLGMIDGDGNINEHSIKIYQKHRENFTSIQEYLEKNFNVVQLIKKQKRQHTLILNKRETIKISEYLPLEIQNYRKHEKIKEIISKPFKNTTSKRHLFAEEDIENMKIMYTEYQNYSKVQKYFGIDRKTVKRWIS